jgi:hypothetical protein
MKRTLILIGLIALSATVRAEEAPAHLDVATKALAGKALSEEELVPRGFFKNGEAKAAPTTLPPSRRPSRRTWTTSPTTTPTR